jgi:hypothetical protein
MVRGGASESFDDESGKAPVVERRIELKDGIPGFAAEGSGAHVPGPTASQDEQSERDNGERAEVRAVAKPGNETVRMHRL